MPKFPITLLLVEKSGNMVPISVRDLESTDLYHRAKHTKPDGFNVQATWTVMYRGIEHSVMLYAKEEGRPGMENRCEFPPPVDKKLFFGGCILAGLRDKKLVSLTPKQWKRFYEYLMGGFHDTSRHNQDDAEEEEVQVEEERQLVQQGAKRTHDGYIKDGFVVDDDEASDVSASDQDASEDEEDEDEDNDEQKDNQQKNN
jgi:hypothetical protein